MALTDLFGGGFIKFIIIAVVVSIVGGGYLYIQAKDNRIQELKDEITIEKQLNDDLRVEIASRDNKIVSLQLDNARFQGRLDFEKVINADLRERENAIRQEANDKQRQERVSKLMLGRRAALMERVWGESDKCEWENFFKFNGTCKAGRFIKDGERLVPKAEEEDNS